MPSLEVANKDVVRKYPREIISKGNLDLIDEIIADEYVQHNSAISEDFHGPDAVRENVSRLRAGFSDITCGVEDLIADGNKVVRRDRATGTHDGEYMGIEPTGKEIVVEGIHLHRLENGQLVETWAQTDTLGVLQQLGVVDPP